MLSLAAWERRMRMGSREEGIPDAVAPPEAKLHETIRAGLTLIFIRLLC